LNLFAPNLVNYPGAYVDESLKGNSCEYAAPHSIYRCKGEDRWCAISVFSDEECRLLQSRWPAGMGQ